MRTRTGHVVVDGSNIATEGRSMPSLSQLNDAVLAFLDEFPGVTVTVVVDATFGHRIDKSEVKEFDTAIANNELVAPPAGAVGRGDAFVLSIADKANASVLSNDSFQEFHGDYAWLFDEGRLVGGKPVPHVGWVFVDRLPVRGPVSRKSVRESKDDSGSRRSSGRSKRTRATARTGSKEASQPMPVPQKPPPGRVAKVAAGSASGTRSRRGGKRVGASDESGATMATGASRSAAPTADETMNDLMPFLDFVEHHPVGTSVNAIVESYSSHGAYVRIGDVRGYVPMRLMSDPPPRSAREVMKVGDAVTLVVASFAPARRGIDCAVPHMATDLEPQDPMPVIEQTAASASGAPVSTGDRAASAPTAGARATTTSARKSASKKAPAKKAPAKKGAAKKGAAKKAPGTKAATTPAPVEKAAAKRAPAKRGAAKKAPGTKAPVKRAPAKKAPAKKVSAKRAPAKKVPAKKVPAKKVPAKKASGRRAAGTTGTGPAR